MLPMYDPLTKKINGCSIDGNFISRLFYAHEYRHKIQDKKGLMSFYLALLFDVAFLLALLSFFKEIDWSWIPLTLALFLGYLEIDAWVYAFKNHARLRYCK